MYICDTGGDKGSLLYIATAWREGKGLGQRKLELTFGAISMQNRFTWLKNRPRKKPRSHRLTFYLSGFHCVWRTCSRVILGVVYKMRSKGEYWQNRGFVCENLHPVVVEAVVVDFHIVPALTEIKQRHIACHSKTKYFPNKTSSSFKLSLLSAKSSRDQSGSPNTHEGLSKDIWPANLKQKNIV